MKSSTYFIHTKTKILADFQICISVPLKSTSCIKLPVQTEILFVAGILLVIFLLTSDILVMSLHYLPGYGLRFFCFLLCGGFMVVVVA